MDVSLKEISSETKKKTRTGCRVEGQAKYGNRKKLVRRAA